MKNTLAKMKELDEALSALVEKRVDQFDARSEKWQESDKGQDFLAMTDRMEEFNEELKDLYTELTE